MKNMLRLLLHYIFTMINCIYWFTLCYLSCFYARTLVCGARAALSGAVCISALFSAAVFAFLFTPLFLMLYIARQKNKMTLAALGAFLSLLNLLAFIPLLVNMERNYGFSLPENMENVELTDGFFRKTDESTYYFLRDGNRSLSRLKLYSEKNSSPIVSEDAQKSVQFFDPLVEESQKTEYAAFYFDAASRLNSLLRNDSATLLYKLSFAFALSAAVLLLFIGEWSLLEAFSCTAFYLLVLFVNSFFTSSHLETVRNASHSLLSLVHLDASFSLTAINLVFLVFLLIFFLFGMLGKFRRHA